MLNKPPLGGRLRPWGFLGKPSCGAADETTKPSVRQLINATFTLYLQDFLWWAQCVLIVKQLHFVTPALSTEKWKLAEIKSPKQSNWLCDPFLAQGKALKVDWKSVKRFTNKAFQVEGQSLRITSKSNGHSTLQVVPNKSLSAQKNISLFKKPQEWWPLRPLHLAAGGSSFSFLLTWQRRITMMSGDPITLGRLGQDSCPVLHWQHLLTMCHVWNASHKVQMRLSQPLGGERDPHGEETLHKECAAKVWKHLKIHYPLTRVLLLYI